MPDLDYQEKIHRIINDTTLPIRPHIKKVYAQCSMVYFLLRIFPWLCTSIIRLSWMSDLELRISVISLR